MMLSVLRMMWRVRVVCAGVDMVHMGVPGEVECKFKRGLDHGRTAAVAGLGMRGKERLLSEDISESMFMSDESADQHQPRGELVRRRRGVGGAVRVCVCDGAGEGE